MCPIHYYDSYTMYTVLALFVSKVVHKFCTLTQRHVYSVVVAMYYCTLMQTHVSNCTHQQCSACWGTGSRSDSWACAAIWTLVATTSARCREQSLVPEQVSSI